MRLGAPNGPEPVRKGPPVELVNKDYNRLTSIVMIKRVYKPTRANLEFAAFDSNVMREDPGTYVFKPPAKKPKLADLHFGGTPGLRVGDMTSAGLHFQELRSAMPYLIMASDALVRKYKAASARVLSESQAVDVVGKILSRNEDNRLAIKARCNESAEASA